MKALSPPRINTPFEDTVDTNLRPLISFFNSKDGILPRQYCVQIDRVPSFDSIHCLSYEVMEESSSSVTSCRVAPGDELADGKQYFYRVRAFDALGNTSEWMTTRFFLDTRSDDTFSGLQRTPVAAVTSSGGQGEQHLINLTENAEPCFWQGTERKTEQWISFDLGVPREIAGVWILGDKKSKAGRLKDYTWQYSQDGQAWNDIPQSITAEADSFRRILNFSPVTAQYFRILIRAWHGHVPRLREVILYHTGSPPIPEVPSTPYVLTISNYFTGDERPFDSILEQMKLDSVVIPYHAVSLAVLQGLETKPVAILLSGAARWFEDLPMFEFNGVFEILRVAELPIFGSCAGHQLMSMAYGYSFVRDSGHFYSGSYPINIQAEDKIFCSLGKSFLAYELHGWEMVIVPEDMNVIARSYGADGGEVVEMIADKSRLIYGAQFHGEKTDWPGNEQAGRIIRNFLELALGQAAKLPREV